jgi:hypothetical protein
MHGARILGWLAATLVTGALVMGCAGPSKLAEKSEKKLAGGEHWRAWELATRALAKEPGNARGRAAAAAAAASIAQDWQRRIRALAHDDSLAAAEQVLELSAFRAAASRYTTVAVSEEWARSEKALRLAAARHHYQRGKASLESRRPKKAHAHFADVERFVPGYRDAAKLGDRAYEKGITRVAFVPFRSSSRDVTLGREVSARWRDDIGRDLAPPIAQFTRFLGLEAVEAKMTVAQLGSISRADAVRLGRKAGADRVVWGSIGEVDSDTRLELFKDVIARRVTAKDGDGNDVTRWVDVPIEVVARVRQGRVDFEHQVITVHGGPVLAHHRDQNVAEARVVWTSYAPEGELSTYALVAEPKRTASPDQARKVEARWKAVCGEKTTLHQVLEARRATRGSARYRRDVLNRFIAGAAFMFLEDLPPPEDLAFAALADAWGPLREDLLRLDGQDDVDLGMPVGMPVVEEGRR